MIASFSFLWENILSLFTNSLGMSSTGNSLKSIAVTFNATVPFQDRWHRHVAVISATFESQHNNTQRSSRINALSHHTKYEHFFKQNKPFSMPLRF